MKHYTVNIIGAGKLGKTIGYLLTKHNLITVHGVVNTNSCSAQQAVDFIQSGVVYNHIHELPHADITFISATDNQIKIISERLSQNANLRLNDLVVHFSGALDSSELHACKNKGCKIASIHPMLSIAKPEFNVQHFAGTYCALDGDEAALTILQELFTKIHAITYTISAQHKALYHTAGVFASNYVITLAQEATYYLQQAGVDETIIMPIINQIMQQTLNQLQQTNSPSMALTGPIKRGDNRTIKKHLDAILSSKHRDLYTALGIATLDLAQLSSEKKCAILDILLG